MGLPMPAMPGTQTFAFAALVFIFLEAQLRVILLFFFFFLGGGGGGGVGGGGGGRRVGGVGVG